MNITNSKTVQKFLLPCLAAIILRFKNLKNIDSPQEALNVLVQITIITVFLFISGKIIPQFFRRWMNK
jgi:hypothetical protein